MKQTLKFVFLVLVAFIFLIGHTTLYAKQSSGKRTKHSSKKTKEPPAVEQPPADEEPPAVEQPLTFLSVITPQGNQKISGPLGNQEASLTEHNVSLNYSDVNLRDVLKAFAYSYNLNIVLTKDVKGKVSAQLKNQTIDDTLDAVLAVNNYGFTRKGNIIYVMPKADMDPLIESIPVNFLNVKEAKTLLSSSSSGSKVTVEANEATNSLIVRGTPSEIKNIKNVIKEVDVPPIQVLIEAKIVDINKSDIENIDNAIGLMYKASNAAAGSFIRSSPTISSGTISTGATTFNSNGLTIPFNESAAADAGAAVFSNASSKIFTEASINALVKNNKAHVLASPSITTLNGKEASITIGEKFPYQSSSSQNGSSTTSNVTFADVGTKLKVTPTVSSEGWITLKVHPEVSSVKAIIGGNPNIATREADAIVRVRDNQTIVIGGLISKSDLQDRNGIPYLKDIPLLGSMFQGHSTTLSNGELTVFITPHIIPMPQAKVSLEESKDYRGSILTSSSAHDVDILKNLLDYADSLEREKSSDQTNNLYWSQEMISTYRSILQQFPESGKTDYCLYKIALIYAKEFGRCHAAQEALNEMRKFAPQSPYISITEPLVNACMAVSHGKNDEPKVLK